MKGPPSSGHEGDHRQLVEPDIRRDAIEHRTGGGAARADAGAARGPHRAHPTASPASAAGAFLPGAPAA